MSDTDISILVRTRYPPSRTRYPAFPVHVRPGRPSEILDTISIRCPTGVADPGSTGINREADPGYHLQSRSWSSTKPTVYFRHQYVSPVGYLISPKVQVGKGLLLLQGRASLLQGRGHRSPTTKPLTHLHSPTTATAIKKPSSEICPNVFSGYNLFPDPDVYVY